MQRTTLILCLLAALQAPAAEKVIPQRRNDIERIHGIVNVPGELTYSVDEGSARLTIGSAEAGDLVVGDPYAIHFAPRRVLDPSEYGVSLGTNVSYGADGEIRFSTEENMFEWEKASPRTAIITPLNGIALAGASYTVGGPATVRRLVSETEITLAATPWNDPPAPGGIAQPRPVSLSNLVVYAYTSRFRDSRFDATLNHVTIIDTLGSISLADLRKWVLDTYEDRAAEDWSRYPAVSPVRMAGNRIDFNSSGTIFAEMEADSATNALRFVLNASPVLALRPGISSQSAALRIWGFECGEESVAIYVGADLGLPVSIQTTSDLRNPFVLATGATSSYPTTESYTDGDDVSHNCYKLTLPVKDNASAAFFRACATVSSGGDNRLEIDNCDLYILGTRYQPETWTFTLTNGTTVTKKVLVGEAVQ